MNDAIEPTPHEDNPFIVERAGTWGGVPVSGVLWDTLYEESKLPRNEKSHTIGDVPAAYVDGEQVKVAFVTGDPREELPRDREGYVVVNTDTGRWAYFPPYRDVGAWIGEHHEVRLVVTLLHEEVRSDG